MKPVEFHIIMNDKLDEFQEEVNEYLKKNFVFLGDLKIENNVFVREMVRLEPITEVAMPLNARPLKDKKGNK